MVKIVGILNLTPDSFHDGGKYLTFENAHAHALEIHRQGADILDVGAESTRPGSDPVSEEEELRRIRPFFEALGKNFPIPISIDTTKPRVAAFALENGAEWINDISGFSHPEMRFLAAQTKAKICLMHMQGSPKTMQINPSYQEGIMEHLKKWFYGRIEYLLRGGISHDQIIIDPGIGFGKSIEDNFMIIKQLHVLKIFNCPILIGASHKSFLKKTLPHATSTFSATLAINTVAVQNGAGFLRVHDIAEHHNLAILFNKLAE